MNRLFSLHPMTASHRMNDVGTIPDISAFLSLLKAQVSMLLLTTDYRKLTTILSAILSLLKADFDSAQSPDDSKLVMPAACYQ